MNYIFRLRYLCIFVVLASLVSCSGIEASTLAPGKLAWNQEELQQIVKDWRIRSNVPGAVVGLSLANGDEILVASGESDVQSHVAMEVDDQFQIASITKTFIAAEILLLASEGKLRLDDPLNMYLTDIPHADIVTIRHLLSHRSGYFDPIHDDPNFIAYLAEDLAREWTWEEILGITLEHDLFFEPGSNYRYSNTNYLLLALVIEKMTRQPLGQVLASNFISPLQLTQTQYRTVETDVQQTDLVHGYTTHPATGEVIDTMSIPNTAILSVSTDTMVSNASDLLKWSRALYGGHSTILKPAYKKQMLTFDDLSAYGLGVFQFQTPLGESFGHGGDTAGYLSLMEYFPEQDVSLVILVNADAPSIHLSSLRDEILTTLFAVDQTADVEQLLADLKSEDSGVRKSAILALGHMPPGSGEVIRALITVLESDTNAENRKEAALALGFVGQGSAKAIQALNSALKDKDDSVRGAAGIALSLLE